MHAFAGGGRSSSGPATSGTKKKGGHRHSNNNGTGYGGGEGCFPGMSGAKQSAHKATEQAASNQQKADADATTLLQQIRMCLTQVCCHALEDLISCRIDSKNVG